MKHTIKSARVRKSRANDEKIELGSGNVFADLGFQDAEERLLKAKLATKIAESTEKKGWNHAQTGQQTALDQFVVTKVEKAALKNGFSRRPSRRKVIS